MMRKPKTITVNREFDIQITEEEISDNIDTILNILDLHAILIWYLKHDPGALKEELESLKIG